MSNSLVSQSIEAYKQIIRIPQVNGGRFSEDSNYATIDFKQRCLPASEFENFQLVANLDADEDSAVTSQPISLGKSVVFTSPSGTKQVSLKTNQNDTKQQYLLYWSGRRLEHSVDLKALDLHQEIVAKPSFHSGSWSLDERYFFYLAERKPPKTKSFFDQKKPNIESDKDNVVLGNEYQYIEDWGEQLTGISKTVIAVFNTEDYSVNLVNYDGGTDLCITKVFTSPTSVDQLFLVAHHVKPFRLGLIYCTQRRSDLLYLSDWKNSSTIKVEHISKIGAELAIADATISPDGKQIVWLQCPAGGPHNRAFDVIKADIANPNDQSVVLSRKSCPMYFATTNVFLPNCWISEDSILIHHIVKSRTVISTIHITDRELRNFSVSTAKCELASFSLMDISKQNKLLISESSLASAPTFHVGNCGTEGYHFNRFCPFRIDDKFLSSQINWELKSVIHEGYESQYIFVSPKSAKDSKLPLIVLPHGGPHSIITTSYMDIPVTLAATGFAVALINYPGSLGFDSLEDLPGKIGTLDCNAVQACVVDCQKTFENIDSQNVFVFGGSHGGFIALRLIAQHPEFYRACVCRNPVTDFAQLVGVSDIPDWDFVECGLQPSLAGSIQFKDIDQADVLTKMNSFSPAKFVELVKCPVMMALGKKDRRVPMTQGLIFCRMLRQVSPDIPLKIFVYDDDHSLNSVNVHSDVLINTIQWFEQFMNK